MNNIFKISTTVVKTVNRPPLFKPLKTAHLIVPAPTCSGINSNGKKHPKRKIHTNRTPPGQECTPKTPDLVFVPRLFNWIANKLKLKYLQKMWDKDFTEGAFIYGTSKAVCRITEIIHCNNPKELDGLVTDNAKLKMYTIIHTKLTPKQRDIIQLKTSDIKVLIPLSVKLISSNGEKKCNIKLRVLALKWYKQVNGIMSLVLVGVESEFLRDYNDEYPNWLISDFHVLDCTMINEVR
ncbi:uncharacterized protein LOC126264277 [Aethina tumida]|uniref:uncharacterized protein LOC126264277 n=1 Tax=Aethina tumida TaxID=116153 RepID=UPI0021488173|nr:uncharacterized protein LOC126264277 [Aethina tumida]